MQGEGAGEQRSRWRRMKKDAEGTEEQKEVGKAALTQSNSHDVHGDLSRESEGGWE